jgi:hypothetical protein
MSPRVHIENKLAPFLSAIIRAEEGRQAARKSTRSKRPFITITRDAGAGAVRFAEALAAGLNERDGGDRWQAFDWLLVEKVAADHKISKPLVESLEERSRTWLDRLLQNGPESEIGVFRRVARTIRALAETGGSIIVGRGSVFLTQDLPTGIHLSITAPFEYRVQQNAEQHGLLEEAAAKMVRETDTARREFMRRWWPGKLLSDDLFAATLNAARIEREVMVQMILPLVPKLRD